MQYLTVGNFTAGSGLEQELGFQLLERKNRRFTLTAAGEYFYRKSLILIADYEQLVKDAARLAKNDNAVLRIGYLRSYGGSEFHRAVEQFTAKYPEVEVKIEYGNHEELYEMLKTEAADIVLNDQRRAFSDKYVNLILTKAKCFIEISARNPLANAEKITTAELKNTPCILVASPEQREIEREYYRDVAGYQGEFIFAENLEAARLLIIGGKGFMPVEGGGKNAAGTSLVRIPIMSGKRQLVRNYCAFWKKDNSGYYVEEFAEMLKAEFKRR